MMGLKSESFIRHASHPRFCAQTRLHAPMSSLNPLPPGSGPGGRVFTSEELLNTAEALKWSDAETETLASRIEVHIASRGDAFTIEEAKAVVTFEGITAVRRLRFASALASLPAASGPPPRPDDRGPGAAVGGSSGAASDAAPTEGSPKRVRNDGYPGQARARDGGEATGAAQLLW